MPAEIISKQEKDKILEQLKERFGITKLSYLFFRTGREKIRVFSGHLSREEIAEIMQTLTVEIIGIYFLKDEKGWFRPSLDATHLLKDQITRNILVLDDQQAHSWLRGEYLEVSKDLQGLYAVRYGEDFFGCGKASQGRLIHFIPKERRVR